MDESYEHKKKQKNRSIIVFVALCIVAMLTAGYFISGSLNSIAISSKTEPLQQQTDTSSYENINTKNPAITYVYNTTSLAQLYKDVKDSVVVITGYVVQYSFFGQQYSEVQGSGFIYEYKNDMVIITNKHVVNDAMNITVTFSNGDGYPATVVGFDAYSDLAVLSVEAPSREFHPLHITSSSTLQVGDPVVAIGSPFGLGGTMTTASSVNSAEPYKTRSQEISLSPTSFKQVLQSTQGTQGDHS